MYSVNDQTFTNFMDAILAADTAKADVIEVSTGIRRWTPGSVSEKAMRRYHERRAAYKAQEAGKLAKKGNA